MELKPMSKNAKWHANKLVVFKFDPQDTCRFMALEKNVCRDPSWLESLGALTLGSSVIATLDHPKCEGLQGDLRALARDYYRVGGRSKDSKRQAKAS